MQVWQFTGTRQPLRLTKVDEPSPAPGGVVVDVRASGLCHSDVGLLEDEGWLPMLAKTPITVGHEIAGVVSAVGDGVTDWAVGDRVGICPTTPAGSPGYAIDGGYAPKVAIGAQALVRIPDGVSFTDGAYATDGGMTSHHAVIAVGGVGPGTRVGIIGLGGLGQLGARVAVLSGATVYAAEPNEAVWPLAEEIGLEQVRPSVTDFAGLGLDVIVDFAGFGTTTAAAVEVVRRDGRVVLVGMGRLESLINTRQLILNRVQLVGSAGGDPEDIAALYDWMAAGKLPTRTTEIGFSDIPDGLARLAKGEVVGRLVATFDENHPGSSAELGELTP
jgi:propanol-preferring alcohol dehydrogenase